jgi:hypothetical protein
MKRMSKMNNQLDVMDIVYDTIIYACKDLKIEFEENMVDKLMKAYNELYEPINIDDEISTSFIYKFTEVVLKWKNS